VRDREGMGMGVWVCLVGWRMGLVDGGLVVVGRCVVRVSRHFVDGLWIKVFGNRRVVN
jgi:hypothetical protein